MAPIRKPLLLQDICLEEISQLILNQFLIYRRSNINIFNEQFKSLSYFIEKYVPNLVRCELFHIILKRLALYSPENIFAEPIVFLMKALVSQDVKQLNFSDLIYAGSVSYDVLDSFEHGIGEVFPYLPNLTFLDLSTHKNEVSLPSSSYNILESIGWNCPNLRILNLNNNNRVTDDCLKCLAPRKFQQGCPLLEEIYIHECSITPNIVIWLLKTFNNLQKIGYADMGTILKKYCSVYRKRRHFPLLNLTYIDNSESTCSASDGRLINLISDMCPQANNVKVRVCDDDCHQLYKLRSLVKLELRFYTGIHHSIGRVALNYIKSEGRYLTSLTIFCNELESHHVSVITSACYRLNKLYLHCNNFYSSGELSQLSNKLENLKVLSIRIGQHEMDECQFAKPLVRHFLECGYELEELYLLLICKSVNHSFFRDILTVNPLSNIQTFIYDAPRRNRDLAVIPLDFSTALMMLCTCNSLVTIGNLISWQINEWEVIELREVMKKKNLEANIICSSLNKVHTKYF